MARLEGARGRSYSSRAAEYESNARSAADRLVELTPALLKLENAAIPLKLDVGPTALDDEEVIGRIEKGEPIEDPDLRRVERSEFLKAYLGYVATVLDIPDDRIASGSYSSTVVPAVLFKSVGVRVFLSNRTPVNRDALGAARKCLERVLDLTQASPYDRNREEASEFMAKVDAELGKTLPQIRCPVDGAVMKPEWKFCPFHGVKLERKK